MSVTEFDRCQRIGQEGIDLFHPFFKGVFKDGIVYVKKGVLAESLQITVGDAVANNAIGELVSLEFKTEQQDRYRNFFLEEYSNYCPSEPRRNKVGWMQTIQSDWIVYVFMDKAMAYCIRFVDLKTWAYQAPGQRGVTGRIHDFPLKPQEKHSQLNSTHGYCVPIAVIEDEVGFIKVQRCGDDFLLRPVTKRPGEDDKTPNMIPPSIVPRKPKQGEMFT